MKLSAPASEAELNRFYAACSAVNLESADTLRKLADAFAKHVEENGYVVWPIKFAPPPAEKKR